MINEGRSTTNRIIPSKGFTHAGVFHADDVFAAALLTILNPEFEVQRGYSPAKDFNGIVFDIGGGEFDHHGNCRKLRENGIPYAAFGLVWKRFGTMLLCEEDARTFDETFVQPIDNADNGGEFCLLSQLVSDFNPFPPAEPAAYDNAFNNAVVWARNVLYRRFDVLCKAREDRDYVLERMHACDGKVLVLDRLAQWKTIVTGSGYIYVIYPSIRGGYNVQAVPERPGDHSMVLPFPESWRGKPADELQRVSGIEGLSFCHATGFLCAANTLVDAIEIARTAMRESILGSTES